MVQSYIAATTSGAANFVVNTKGVHNGIPKLKIYIATTIQGFPSCFLELY